MSVNKQQEELIAFPISFAQQRLWFLHQMIPNNPLYNISWAIRMQGKLCERTIKKSVEAIVARHESLRTTFDLIDNSPVQIISENREIPLPLIDLQKYSKTVREAKVEELSSKEAQKPFELTHTPLLRTTLLRLAAEEHMLLLTMHHIVSDGWSMSVFMKELSVFYEAFLTGKPVSLSDLEIQYVDFSYWQREYLQGEVLESLLNYWKQKLDSLPTLKIPTDYSRPAVQAFRGATKKFTLPATMIASLEDLSQQRGVTLFMTLLAVFKVLLHRYSGQSDIVIGSPIANRNQIETEGLIGFFVNTLPLRTDLSGNPTFSKFLDQIKEVTLEAYSNQDLPFEKLVDELQVERSLSHTPLFQVIFVLQNTPEVNLDLPDVVITSITLPPTDKAKFDLSLSMQKTGKLLEGVFEYSTDLFDVTTIDRMVGHFQTLLESIVANPKQRISELSMLTEAERHQLLMEWNNTTIVYPQNKCIHELFEEQVEKTPEAVAITFGSQQLTYRELNQKANQLTHHLQKLGVAPEVLVGICVERSLEMIVGLLGILKAGGAYVPLDPDYPTERLIFMLEDTQISVLLTQQALVNKIPSNKAHIVCLDSDWATISQYNCSNTLSVTTSENLAYVIYTSGSTGQPKGVTTTHGNVVRLFEATRAWFNFDSHDVWTLFHSYAFDFSVWEIWGALLHGGRLVVVPFWVTRSPGLFYKLLCSEKVTILNQTPSAFRQLIRVEEQAMTLTKKILLRLVIFGGEALDVRMLKPWFDHHGDGCPQLVNMYGITETTVHVTYYPVKRNDVKVSQGSLIGRPIPDLQIYLLDQYLNLVPVGIPGEIYVGGAGLSRGYLNRPNLTAKKFIPNSFSNEPESLLYKTGDLARYLPDGRLEFLGRADNQVKIRGYRIELGEIETLLEQHAAVRESVVLAREDVPGDARLVAYVVLKQEKSLNVGKLRRFLRVKLPDYMIPNVFVLLDALPLNHSGKVDRHQLPAPDAARPELEEAYVPPRTLEEEVLASIWAEVLDIQKVGIHDNFFAIGGDSLRSIQVLDRAKRRGLDFSLQQLFQCQTIGVLAQEVTKIDVASTVNFQTKPFDLISEEDRLNLPDGVEDAYPLTSLQAGMFYHMELSTDSNVYHCVGSSRIHTQFSFNQQAFQKAVDRVVARHAVLRTSFDFVQYSKPLQLVHKKSFLPVQVEDLRSLSYNEQEDLIEKLVESEKKKPFDFSQPTLLRLFVHLLKENEFHFSITECHPIFDGWSYNSMIVEIFNYYADLLNKAVLPKESQLSISFRDFVALEQKALDSQACKQYWNRKLDNCTILKLPRWPFYSRVNSKSHIQGLFLSISEQVYEGLQQLTRIAKVPLKSVLLAAHIKVMSLLTNQEDVMTGLATNGRPEGIDSARLYGLFLNTVPFRIRLSDETWINLVRDVFETEKEFFPFRRYSLAAIQKDWGRQPLCNEVLFNYIDFHIYDNLSPSLNFKVVQSNSRNNSKEIYEDTNFPLAVHFQHRTLPSGLRKNQLLLQLDYYLNEFCEEQIEAVGSYYLRVLDAMSSDPFNHHGSLSLLSPEEQQQLLVKWNRTQIEYSKNKCIHQLFEEKVEQNPNAVAVIYEGQKLTYRELNKRANQLANYLQALGVGPEILVGICVERSLEMLVGLLGILKAGGAYVPLDPSYPQKRLQFILEDAQISILLTQKLILNKLPQHEAQLVCLDQDWQKIAHHSSLNLNIEINSDNLAYIIYTSGSTGQPKGVMNQHAGICNRLLWMQDAYQLTTDDRVLQKTPFSFDVSVWEFFWPLLVGAKLVVAKPEGHRDIQYLVELIIRQHITTMHFVPSMLAVFLQAPEVHTLKCLRRVFCSGETLSIELQKDFFSQLECKLYNLYGPTEAAIDVTAWQCKSNTDASSVPIGKPIANTQIYILSTKLQPVPIGTSGELHIGGDGLARGYLNRPELTAEKFIDNPFGGGRLYKTGDLARYLPDGNIEFLGRIDYQVKIRGFRIELGEIEAVLSLHEQVQQCVVIDREETPGDKRLVAYVVLHSKQVTTSRELRQFLSQKLPDYMLPSAFVELETIPLTTNGKIDRHALPIPDQLRSDLEEIFIAPRNALELQLTKIWEKVLEIQPIGIKDNFFDLGGHSLLAFRLFTQIHKVFGQELPLETLFKAPDIEKLVKFLDPEREPNFKGLLRPIQTNGSKIPIFWFPSGGTIGSGLALKKLANLLDPERPFFAFQYEEIEKKYQESKSVEEIADRVINEICTIQPEGPYLLLGHCAGGIFAFEIAQQLQAKKHQVNLTGLFNTYSPSLLPKSRLSPHRFFLNLRDRIVFQWSKINSLSSEERLSYILERFNWRLTQIYYRFYKPSELLPPTMHYLNSEELSLEAIKNYVPKIYAGKLVIFKSKIMMGNPNLDLGWSKLVAGRIEVKEIPGHFTDLMKDKQIQHVAAHLRDCIDKPNEVE